VSIKQRASAKNLPCLFADLVEKYSEVGLKPCETKKSQRWRHASTQDAAQRLAFYHNYFTELSDLHSSLDSYSLCERHYNQVIVTDQLSQHLTGSKQDNKRLRFSADEDNAHIPIDHSDALAELERVRRLLEYNQRENQQKSQLITELNNQLTLMRQQLEDQKNEIKGLKERLQTAYDNTIASHSLYEEQRELQRWNSRYDNQQKRIQAVVDIAEIERKSLYEDVKSLIKDNNRFSLESLLRYTPQDWLSKRNQVVVKFIETLTYNDFNVGASNAEKLYKCAMAVDLIYGSRHGKYVSEMNLAAAQESGQT